MGSLKTEQGIQEKIDFSACKISRETHDRCKAEKKSLGPGLIQNGVGKPGCSTVAAVGSEGKMADDNVKISFNHGKGIKIQPTTLEYTRKVARELASDITHYASKNNISNPHNNRASTLRRTVDEISDKHEIVFKGIVKKLNITEENGTTILRNVADEMFKDKRINWGRIVSVYAFGGRLAKYCSDKNMGEYVEKVADSLGDFVSEKLCPWIYENGGWDAFDNYFPEEKKIEEKIWRGLLLTAFGLGALATMVVAR